MSITITGILVILIFMFIFFKQNIRKTLLDPRMYILLMYWTYWGKVSSITIDLEADILLALSFIIFWITMTLFSKKKYIRAKKICNKIFVGFEPMGIRKGLTSSTQLLLLFIIITYSIINLYVNTEMYGSFEAAMTRFYYRLPVKEMPSYYGTILSVLNTVSVGILFIIRYSNLKYKQNMTIFYIAIAILIFITFPKGTRGALIAIVIIPYMADLILICLENKKFKTFLKSSTIILFSCVIFLAFFLTSFRGQKINDINELQKELLEFDVETGYQSFQEKEEDLMMSDYYLTYYSFGTNIDFLPTYYTIVSVISNPIPRSLWYNKPIAFGMLLTAYKLGYKDLDNVKVKDLGSAFAVGICGEGWANGGYFGVLLYSILLGIYAGFFISFFHTFIIQNRYTAIAFALLCYKVSGAYIRGDILSGVMHNIYPLALFLILLYLVSQFKNSSSLRRLNNH